MEVRVGLCDAERLMAALVFDFRDQGVHGRALARDLAVTDASGAEVTLLRWDRLELGGCILDTHATIQDLLSQDGPWSFVFWRKVPGVNIGFHAQLMRAPGMQYEFLMIDILHFLDLGVTPRLVGYILFGCLKKGILYGNEKSIVGIKHGLVKMNAELRGWYRARLKQLRLVGGSISVIGKITLKMLTVAALKDHGHLKAKGIECRHALGFAEVLLQRRRVRSAFGKAKGTALLRAVTSLMEAYRMMKHSNRNFDVPKFDAHLHKCARACSKAKLQMIPKFHFLIHFGQQAQFAGNPRFHSTLEDESHNRDVVRIVQSCCVADFSRRSLAKAALHAQLQKQLSRLNQSAAIALMDE